MAMHETEILKTCQVLQNELPLLTRTRVPGGWIYVTHEHSIVSLYVVQTSVTSCFVPYSPES